MTRRLFILMLVTASAAVAHREGVKTAHAVRTLTPPKIDGDLRDGVWAGAPATSEFVQLSPDEGRLARNQTFVRVLYDDERLYFGLRMVDSEPSNIQARVVPRDGRFAPRDLVGLLLDTHHDHDSGYGFYINPLGVQHDYQMTGDGSKGYGGNNKGWDGVWSAEATVDDSGWSAEVMIPLTTLSFYDADSLVWGFNVERLSATGHELSNWSPITRTDGSVLRVSRAGHIVGLRDVRPGLRLELLPYGMAGRGRRREQDEWSRDVGSDLKVGFARNVALDLTVNPDYAQVEADPEEINLTRFELLLEERRPFFVEDADLLGRRHLFYSRRIRDPVAGLRVTGRSSTQSFGILAARDRRAAGDRSYGVASGQREVAPNAIAGLLLTGMYEDVGSWQRLGAVDAQLRRDRYGLSTFAARSDRADGRAGYAAEGSLEYTSGSVVGGLNTRWISAGFDLSEVGLVDHDVGVETREVSLRAGVEPRLGGTGQLHVGQSLSFDSRSSEEQWDWEWTTAEVSFYAWNDMFASITHSLWHWSWERTPHRGQTLALTLDSGDGRSWTARLDGEGGDRYDFVDGYFGSVRAASGTMQLRPGPSLVMEVGAEVAWEYRADGARDERKTVVRSRVTYLPSRRWLLRAFVQEAEHSAEATVSLLASYEIAPRSHAYLAYNRERVPTATSSRLQAKVAYLFSP